MAIVKPNQLDFSNKKVNMIIAGVAGIGKTTLALSSPKPLLIDLDGGIGRVEAIYRKDCMMCENYNELEKDLKENDLRDYETIVIDTGGKLLEMLKEKVISDNPKNGKSDGNLSLQGYGAVKREFSNFISMIKSLNKHLIIIFHATEVKLKDDVTGLRIRMEGSSRDEVWDDIDIGGFVEMVGRERTIGFSNCERYYAKGTHSISGIMSIPRLEKGKPNTFITDLFNNYLEALNKETKELKDYQLLMDCFKAELEDVDSVEKYNELFKQMKTYKHVLTSEVEIKHIMKSKAKEMKLVYDKERDLFSNAEPVK